SQSASARGAQVDAPATVRPQTSESEFVEDGVVVESLAPDVVPPYEPTVLAVSGEDDDWVPSAAELEEGLAGIQRLRGNTRDAEARVTLWMGQTAYQISAAVAH
ncbi:hypothetical protein BGX21_007746, partial [Mortierella sp. AD011]